MSDIGKLQRPDTGATIDPAELAHDAPVAALDDPAAARQRAGGELKYRASGGAGGVAPMQRLMDERRAIGGQLAARVQRKANGAPGSVAISESGGAKLPDTVRARMEPKLGADLADVHVHTGGESAQAASGLGARAFTVGSDVHFNAGEFAPGSKEGDRLLAHELTHVVQGKKSGVQAKLHRDTNDTAAASGGNGITTGNANAGAGSGDGGGAAASTAAVGSAAGSHDASAAGSANANGHEVSHPDEPAEKEADAVADGVTNQLHGSKDNKKKDKKEHAHGGDAATPGSHGDDADSGEHDAAHGNSSSNAAAAHDSANANAAGGGNQNGNTAVAGSGHAPSAKPAAISAKYVGIGRKIFRNPTAGAASAGPAGAGPSGLQVGQIAKDNQQKKVDGVTQAAIDDPSKHPYFETFKARVIALFASGKVDKPSVPPAQVAADIWAKVCTAMKKAMPDINNPAMYSDWANKYINMQSPEYTRAVAQFDSVGAEIAKFSSSQFAKAKKFGFWSTPEGRALSEQGCDLTLETSGVGALFNEVPTLDAATPGWDADLWGGLSRAYATAVGNEVVGGGKTVHVCIGAGARKDNVWGNVESTAIGKVLARAGKTLSSVVTYHGAAAKSKADRKTLDMTKNIGLPGAVYSGPNWDAAAQAAQAHFEALPAAPVNS